MKELGKLDKIIEDATTDAYSEYEEFSGWFCVLEENISVPQECKVREKPAVLYRIVEAMGGLAIHGEVGFGEDRKRIPVPIEYVELKKKSQRSFIEAYKKWLG